MFRVGDRVRRLPEYCSSSPFNYSENAVWIVTKVKGRYNEITIRAADDPYGEEFHDLFAERFELANSITYKNKHKRKEVA